MKLKLVKSTILLFLGLMLLNTAASQVFGDGSDGDITRSSSGSESGIIEAQTYTVQSGVTRTVSGSVVIHATEKITIDGTLTSTSNNGGGGGSPRNSGGNGGDGKYIDGGGAGGTSPSGSDGDGNPGNTYGGAGGGGWGACNGGERGGNGGNGGSNTGSIPSETQTSSISGSTYLGDRSGWSELYNLPSNIGAGGGGGGGGGESEQGNANNAGGDGGSGGGMIILVAPDIEITGNVYSRGERGQDGEGVSTSSSCSPGGGGGGGGGGSGGIVYLVQDTLTENGVVSVSGGGRGNGQDNSGWAHEGADGASGASGEIYRVDAPANEAPDTTNPFPEDNANTVNVNPTLSIDVSDPNGDSMDVSFYTGGGSQIGSDSNVCSGCTASTSWINRNTGTTYNWYAVADDGSTTTQSSTWSFTTVHEPNSPSNPSPSDGASDLSTGSNLQVDVSHPDGLNMDVTFRINDGNGWRTVSTDSNVNDGGTASANPSLDISESYNWYAESSASGYTTQSSTWGFTTEHNTSASLSGPSNNPAPVNPELEALVSHSDSTRDLTVEFVNDDNGEIICTQSNVNDGDTVTCDPSSNNFADDTGTTYNWRVELSGSEASESWTSSVQSFDTVSAPAVSLSSPSDGAENVSTDTDLIVDTSQAEGLNLNTVITLEDSTGSFVDDYSVSSHSPSQITWSNPNLELSENYQWYADTSINDAAYSQSDLSPTRSFTTEHDFRVDQISPADSNGAVGVNDTVDIEVFHSSDRSIDVEFYFSDTISGTPNATRNVASSGSAVNATIDTNDFTGFGESEGTQYNWSYRVSDGASDTNNITGEGLNFTTVHRPEVSASSPSGGATNVDLDAELEALVAQEDNIDVTTSFMLSNTSGSETGQIGGISAANPESGVIASVSLEEFSFIEPATEYEWTATGSIINPNGGSQTIENQSLTETFTTSERPSVQSITPIDGKTGVSANPLLNVTADHVGNDQLTVEFYDWEKAGSEALIGSKTIGSGETASMNISEDEIGDAPEVYRWYVNVTTSSGTSWNNQNDPYEFTVSSIEAVEFTTSTNSDVNLNPGNAGEQGLENVVGQDSITFQVSNDLDAEMPGIAFNVSNSTHSEVFGAVNDVKSGSAVKANLEDSDLVTEDQKGYQIQAFYRESGTDFTEKDFQSKKIEFSTYVAELEWVNPGQPGSRPIEEYRIYHNDRSSDFSEYSYVGNIQEDGAGITVGAAPQNLGDSSVNECFRIVSWNIAGESSPTSEQCVGVIP